MNEQQNYNPVQMFSFCLLVAVSAFMLGEVWQRRKHEQESQLSELFDARYHLGNRVDALEARMNAIDGPQPATDQPPEV